MKWCPFSDELVKHATWVDYSQQLESSFTSVEFFVRNFKYGHGQVVSRVSNPSIPESVKAQCGFNPLLTNLETAKLTLTLFLPI